MSIGSAGRSGLVQADVQRLLLKLENDLEFPAAGAKMLMKPITRGRY